jgi:archaellum component FlaC
MRDQVEALHDQVEAVCDQVEALRDQVEAVRAQVEAVREQVEAVRAATDDHRRHIISLIKQQNSDLEPSVSAANDGDAMTDDDGVDAVAVAHDATADEEPQDDNADKAKDGELFGRVDRIADPQSRSVVQAAPEGLPGPRCKRSEGADNGRRAKRPRGVVVGDVPAAHCKLCSVQLTERWPRGAFGPVDSGTKLYHTKLYCPSKSGTQPPIVAWSHDEYSQHKSEARHTQREAHKRATSAAAAE